MSPPNTPSPTVSRTVRMGQGAGPQPNLAGTSIQGIGRTATPPPRQPPNWQTTVTQPPGGQQGVVDPFITVIRSSSPPILPITQPIAIPVPTTQPQPPPPQPIAPQPMPPLVPFPQQPPVTTQQQQLPLPIPPVTVASTQPTQPPPGQPPVGGTFGGGEQRLVELPKFNGDIDDPYQWWRSFNEACEANNISLERRLQIVPTCLKGQAEVWRKTPGLVILTWDGWPGTYEETVSFRKQFFDYFSTTQHQQKWMNELRNRRMKEGETVDAYAGALTELYMKADPLGQYPESDKLQAFLNGLPSQIRMFTELAVPRGFREAWEQAKKVESTLRKDNPFNNDSLQHINTLVATQVTQLGQNVNALAMEIREGKVMSNQGNVSTVIKQDIGQGTAQKETNEQNVTIVEKKATYQVNQQPRRVLLNQEYYEEQQEPQYYTGYQPPVYYQNQQPIQNYQQQYLPPQPIQQQPQTDTFGALATAGGALEEKKAPDKKIDAITSKVLIDNRETEVIIDTGSGLSVITKQYLDKLGKRIDQESYSQLIDVNGNKTRPLGIAKEILVTLDGKRPINIDMVVLKADNYNVILGNNWLKQIEATINFKKKILEAKENGKIIQHPIIFEKEPKEVIFEGNELYEDEVLQEEAAYFVEDMGGEWKETPVLTIKGEADLTHKQEQQLDKFINEYKDRFAEDLLELGRIKDYEHHIPTTWR
ncbi:991_t:CDS:2 [Entrophospora sp. SA101]|nr:991_t:CDS:2 [Entrophospora sp. SA101]